MTARTAFGVACELQLQRIRQLSVPSGFSSVRPLGAERHAGPVVGEKRGGCSVSKRMARLARHRELMLIHQGRLYELRVGEVYLGVVD